MAGIQAGAATFGPSLTFSKLVRPWRRCPRQSSRQGVCPHFHAAIELIGKRWTGAIVCALTEGPLRFGELAKAVPGLSDRLLSQRLRELEEEGLVEREVEAGRAGPGHLLADRGRAPSCGPAIAELKAWARRWNRAGARRPVSRAVGSAARAVRGRALRPQAAGGAAPAGAGAAGRRGDRRLRAARSRPTSSCATPRARCPARSGSTTSSSAGLPEGGLRDGAEVVIAGGPDYYPGGGQASPSFSFRATHVRLAGEGDLLARLEALRKQLRAEGLFELQKQLGRPLLPKTIGVVTAESRRRAARPARRPAAARLGGQRRLGLRPGAGPPRGAGDRGGDPGPGGAAGGRGDRRHQGRRQPRRPLGVLRRDPLPHGRDAARAGDQRRRPRARLDPDRRRRRRRLLDPDPRRRGGRAARLPRRAARAGALRRSRCGGSASGAVGARTRHLAALARGPARALRRERVALNQKTREIRAASERGVGARLSFQRRIARRRPRARRAPRGGGGSRAAAAKRCTGPRSRSAPTNPSARSNAATPSPRTPAASRSTSAAAAVPPTASNCASPTAASAPRSTATGVESE